MNEQLANVEWLDADILEANPPLDSLRFSSCELSTKLLTAAVTFFPGAVNRLILFLCGRLSMQDFLSSVQITKITNSESFEVACLLLKGHFEKLKPEEQSALLLGALTEAISNLPKLPEHNNGLTPYELYCRCIEEDLVGSIVRMASIRYCANHGCMILHE